MPTRHLIIVALLAQLLAACAAHVSEAPDADATVNEILESSGLRWEIRQAPLFFRNMKADNPAKKAMLDSTRPEIVEPIVATELRKHLSDERIGQLREWLRLPLTKRMIALETLGQDAMELSRFGEELKKHPAAPKRVALLTRLDHATRMSEKKTDESLQFGLRLGRLEQPNATAAELAEAKKYAASMRPAMVEGVTNKVLIGNLHTYRYASEEDLEKYVPFYESPLGHWWSDLRHNLLLTAAQKTTQHFARPK